MKSVPSKFEHKWHYLPWLCTTSNVFCIRPVKASTINPNFSQSFCCVVVVSCFRKDIPNRTTILSVPGIKRFWMMHSVNLRAYNSSTALLWSPNKTDTSMSISLGETSDFWAWHSVQFPMCFDGNCEIPTTIRSKKYLTKGVGLNLLNLAGSCQCCGLGLWKGYSCCWQFLL